MSEVFVTASVLALVPLNLLAAALIVALWLCLSLGLCVHCEVSTGCTKDCRFVVVGLHTVARTPGLSALGPLGVPFSLLLLVTT